MKDFFKKLTEEINKHKRIIIMTHTVPDLDGMGSAIVFHKILESMGKENVIVAPKQLIDTSLNKVINYVSDNEVIPFTFEKKIDCDDSLLVIFDTREENLVECPELVSKIKDKIVIDHHSKGLNSIKGTILESIDERKSSTTEMVTDYLKYLDLKLDSIFYTILFTGLVVDTHNFNFKTTEQTFSIASYLLSLGANMELKQEFLKESMEKFLNRYSYIENSVILQDGVCLAIVDDKYTSSVEIAKLATEILKFEDIKLSLAIGRNENSVLVSARSMGGIDVSKLMMKLGGGGHKHAAASKIYGEEIDSVLERIKAIIKEGL